MNGAIQYSEIDVEMSASELAHLAWSLIDIASRDPQYAEQLTLRQWKQLGRFMGAVVLLFQQPEEAEQ